VALANIYLSYGFSHPVLVLFYDISSANIENAIDPFEALHSEPVKCFLSPDLKNHGQIFPLKEAIYPSWAPPHGKGTL
jgi:hypothetical protein